MEPYHIKHQYQETANIQNMLCILLLAAHETQTLNACMTKSVSMGTHLKLNSIQTNDSNINTPFTLP